MNISAGFQVEQPAVFVPWGITPAQLLDLAGGLTEVTRGYYTARCVSLGGLSHQLGFHFYPAVGGRLTELEFFQVFATPLSESFETFQLHLEATFGPPKQTEAGSAGFPAHTWRFRRVRIVHSVFDRFGLEEHVRIQHK